MLSSIGYFLLGVALASVCYFFYFRQKNNQQKNIHQQVLIAERVSAKQQLMAVTEQFKTLQSSIEVQKQLYIKPIADVLDASADNADTASLEIEKLAERLNSLQQTIETITAESNAIQQVAENSSDKITLTITELSQLTQSQQDLLAIEKQFADIQEKTNSIRYIGEEAEMLALNAAIEAARAGDAGRGFAVVADNMKQLAKNSQATTSEILDIVDQCGKIMTEVVTNFSSRGDNLNSTINDLVDSFSDISSIIIKMQSFIATVNDNSNAAMNLCSTVEKNTKNGVEMLVKELSNVVSVITEQIVTDITPQQAKASWQEFDQVIDVRRESEWHDELGHISGVKFSTLQTNFKQDVKTLDKSKSYLFICRSGGRSTKAAQMALALGVSSVSNLDGGMLAWRKSGF